VSDVIADLRRQMQDRLKEIDGELKSVEALVSEREQIEAARAPAPTQRRAAHPHAAALARAPRAAPTARRS
jgi:hypothetical protein